MEKIILYVISYTTVRPLMTQIKKKKNQINIFVVYLENLNKHYRIELILFVVFGAKNPLKNENV